MRRIVVLGSGIAGFRAARTLERSIEGRRHLELLVIDETDHFLYPPLLVHVVSDELDVRSITFSVSDALGDATRVVRERIESIDLAARELDTGSDQIAFDYLVLAPGGRTDWRTAPECRAHARPFGSAADAASIRDRLRNPRPQRADSQVGSGPTCVVIGAGPTGVELAAEIASPTSEDGRPEHPDWRVVLVERESGILPALPDALRTTTRMQLDDFGVEVRPGARAVRTSEQGVELEDGAFLEADLVVWCGGRRPARIADDLEASRDADGRLDVDARLAIAETPGVYVAGDAASPPSPAPGRADIAAAQGERAAENVLAELSGRTTTRWSLSTPRPWYLSVGPRAAAVFRNGETVTGPAAWVLYRLWHTRMMPGALNKAGLLRAWLRQSLE